MSFGPSKVGRENERVWLLCELLHGLGRRLVPNEREGAFVGG